MNHGFEDVQFLPSGEVGTVLDLGGRGLVKGYRGEFGLPVEAFLRLYVVEEEEAVALVDGPEVLSRFVAGIGNVAEAVAFLSVFTSPLTHYLFPSLGGLIELAVLPDPSARPACVSPERFRSARLRYGVVREEAERVLTERNLVGPPDGGSCPVIRMTEAVARDGSYELLSREAAGELSPPEVGFPVYE